MVAYLLQHRQSSPLGGCGGVQHAAPLHPAPDSVHSSQRLLLQAAAASLDALLDSEHEQTSVAQCLSLSVWVCPRLAVHLFLRGSVTDSRGATWVRSLLLSALLENQVADSLSL